MHLQGLAKISRRKEEKEHFGRLSFAGRLLQQSNYWFRKPQIIDFFIGALSEKTKTIVDSGEFVV
jgi:hypothetical protein